MKKYFVSFLLLMLVPGMCLGASARYTQLVREKQNKMEELEKCMGSTKGLKIAGVSTLGLTAAGVAANIYEAKTIKTNEKTIEKNDKRIKTAQEDLDNAIKEQKAQQLESAMAQCNAKTFYEWENGKCVLVDAAGECSQRGGQYNASEKTCLCGQKEMKSYEQCKDGSASVLPIPEETEEENVPQLEVCSQEILDSHNAKMGFWLKAEDDSMECFITKCKDGFHTTLNGNNYTVSSYKDFDSDVVCTAESASQTNKSKNYKYLDISQVDIDKDCNLKRAHFSQGLYLGGSAANCEDEMNENGCPNSISMNQYGECRENTTSERLNREGDECRRCREILDRRSICISELNDYCERNGVDRADLEHRYFLGAVTTY